MLRRKVYRRYYCLTLGSKMGHGKYLNRSSDDTSHKSRLEPLILSLVLNHLELRKRTLCNGSVSKGSVLLECFQSRSSNQCRKCELLSSWRILRLARCNCGGNQFFLGSPSAFSQFECAPFPSSFSFRCDNWPQLFLSWLEQHQPRHDPLPSNLVSYRLQSGQRLHHPLHQTVVECLQPCATRSQRQLGIAFKHTV